VRRVAGFDPYLGTLNVRLADPADVARWRAVREATALPVVPPTPQDCGGQLVLVRLADGVEGAVVIPDVTRYGDEIIEILAPDHLRTRLGLRDGDVVFLEI
jgi:riboflavin kinase